MKPTIANYLGLADTHLGCKKHERQALLKIKQDLIDDYGHLSSWSSDQDWCTWSGVKCSNQTGHVIMLNLNVSFSFPSRPLQGKLNLSLIELKYLTYLDMRFNDFNQSQILKFIASLSNLRHLGFLMLISEDIYLFRLEIFRACSTLILVGIILINLKT